MARQQNRLAALDVQRKSTPGRYSDGAGLYLQVGPTGAKSWLFRYQIEGKARVMGLGPINAVSLKLAREKAGECRRLLADGRDPMAAREEAAQAARIEAARNKSFQDYGAEYIAANEHAWSNAKHRQQWRNTLATYAYPLIGPLPVREVDANAVAGVLRQLVEPKAGGTGRLPLWIAKPETADRLRGRIEAILDYALAEERCDTANPARLHARLTNLLPQRPRVAQARHHAALPFDDLPAFVSVLHERQALGALALEFLILTAARTCEVLSARWDEIDLAQRVWTVPASRMKAGREHRVPLAPPALAILDTLAALRRDEMYLFPGFKRGKPLSNMVLLQLLKRMGRHDLTAHGFRSTFRDWAAERTAFASEVVEMALAHVIENKVEAAYRRGDLFEKRRALMSAWADYCGGHGTFGRVVDLIPKRAEG